MKLRALVFFCFLAGLIASVSCNNDTEVVEEESVVTTDASLEEVAAATTNGSGLAEGLPVAESGEALPVAETAEAVVAPEGAPPPTQEIIYPPINVVTPSPPKPRRYPCKCTEGVCNCCAGAVLENLTSLSVGQRLCTRVTYEPEEFAFHYKFMFNRRVLYEGSLSGKNPPPVCVPISRLIAARACVRFSNVFILKRNLHACVDIEGEWLDFELFGVSFDCFRIGTSGFATLKPEDGGGLPTPALGGSGDDDYDYDDSARHHLNSTLSHANETESGRTPWNSTEADSFTLIHTNETESDNSPWNSTETDSFPLVHINATESGNSQGNSTMTLD